MGCGKGCYRVLWIDLIQKAITRMKEEKNQIISVPRKKASSVPSGCIWQTSIAWSGRLTSLFTWSDSGVNLYCLLDKAFHTARFPARKHTQLQSINILARKYAWIHIPITWAEKINSLWASCGSLSSTPWSNEGQLFQRRRHD